MAWRKVAGSWDRVWVDEPNLSPSDNEFMRTGRWPEVPIINPKRMTSWGSYGGGIGGGK